MSYLSLYTPGFSSLGRCTRGVARQSSIAVPEALRVGLGIPVPKRGSRESRQTTWLLRVAELVSPDTQSASSQGPNERFLDVRTILDDFNPLKGSHLLVWSDSEDEDGAVSVGLPEVQAGAWEDTSAGYQGLEHQPSWIDYRDGSESDDSDSRLRGALGASKALEAVLPQLDNAILGNSNLAGASSAIPLPNAYSADAGFQEIAPHELEERLATGQFSLLLDVRSHAEYESGHIAGATCLPLDPDLSAAVRAGSLDEFRDRPVAVVCGSGKRSSQATVRLTKVFGFENVTNVRGGMMAWAAEGLPVQSSGQLVRNGGGGGCGCGGSGSAGGGGCRKQA